MKMDAAAVPFLVLRVNVVGHEDGLPGLTDVFEDGGSQGGSYEGEGGGSVRRLDEDKPVFVLEAVIDDHVEAQPVAIELHAPILVAHKDRHVMDAKRADRALRDV